MNFEALIPGLVIRAGPRSVDQTEIVAFASRYDAQPFHINEAAAGASRWRGLIASGWMTCSIAMELAVEHILQGSECFGSPGIDALKWTRPVRPGDELTLTVTVLESRISKSGGVGIIRWRWELHNQTAVLVLSMVATSYFDVSAGG
jgi:acyl dehydratase